MWNTSQVVEFVEKKLLLTLDDWQKKVIETEGNMCLRSGRQVGKSTIIAVKTAIYALRNNKKLIMIISKTEKQASLLFQKILHNVHGLAEKEIKKGKDRPTKHKLSLRNGTVIHCLPAGDTGFGIMGYTINLLIADEAAFIPEEVWNSILPALAVARGDIWVLSTPFINEGYYHKCFSNPSFTSFHTTSEECPRKDQQFLNEQKKNLTQSQYAQMYLGEFITEFNRVFSAALIKKCCILKENKEERPHPNRDYFLGVDIARMGSDDSTFECLDGTSAERIRQVYSELTKKKLTTETTRNILRQEDKWSFNKIGIDDGGMGVGVLDPLLEDSRTKRKVVALNNATRAIDADGKSKKLLKEDMYNNLVRLMEWGYIRLLDDSEVIASLESIQMDENGRINGRYSHIAEGLIRAAWLIKAKGLKPYITSL